MSALSLGDVPVWIDLYPCEGGASRGYFDAGFFVLGVDLWQKFTRARYPFPGLKSDAILALDVLLAGGVLRFDDQHTGRRYFLGLEDIAGFSASPPCQRYSVTNHNARDYPDLIGPTRDRLAATGKPYVIENVVGAPLLDPVLLCGCMFDLTAPDSDGVTLHLQRARLFESNIDLTAPRPCDHTEHLNVAGAYGGARRAKRLEGETLEQVAPRDRYEAKHVRHGGYVPRNKHVVEALMDIDWMTWAGLHQAIPPAYTRHLGAQVLAHLDDLENAA